MTCVELVSNSHAKNANQLDAYLTTDVEMERAFSATDSGFSDWASKIRSGNNDFYRGMVLSEAELQNILEVGFAVDKTDYGGIYVDQAPERALDFMTVRFKQTPKLGVIFVLDLSDISLEHRFDKTWTSKSDISSKAIKQIWLFDKKGSAEFPFLHLKPIASAT